MADRDGEPRRCGFWEEMTLDHAQRDSRPLFAAPLAVDNSAMTGMNLVDLALVMYGLVAYPDNSHAEARNGAACRRSRRGPGAHRRAGLRYGNCSGARLVSAAASFPMP